MPSYLLVFEINALSLSRTAIDPVLIKQHYHN